MATKADRPKIPEFSSETEEAQWWDEHAGMVEEELIKAMRAGTARKGTAGRLAQEARDSNQAAPESEEVTICMPTADLDRARRLSANKGLCYRTYLKTLLHEAIDREESRSSQGTKS